VAGALGAPVGVYLPLSPQDFTRRPAGQTFVHADELRVRRVTAAFLLTTRRLQRASPPALASGTFGQLLLAGADTLVDNAKTQRLAAGLGLTVATLPHAAHSLVLEDPEWVAARIAAQARKAEGAP
jgi:pimeloyl-ACP methyl ester carboxylesterase